MLTTTDLIARLDQGPALVQTLIDDVPPADLTRRPAPQRWSAHEHACHLALMEPMWAERLERILAEDHPRIISYEPDTDEPPDRLLRLELQPTLAGFAHDRAAFVARLRTLSNAEWARGASHTSHTRYSLYLMCRHMTMHDGLHAYRIEEFALGSHWPLEAPPTTPTP